MDNRINAVIILEISALLLSLAAQQFMLLPIIAAAAGYLACRTKARTDHHLLSFSRELCGLCSSLSASAALRRACLLPTAPAEMVSLERRINLGDIEAQLAPIADPEVAELTGIVLMGVRDGKDIRKNLGVFVSRLEAQAETRNGIIRSTLNLETLSGIGVMFFIPLFGGIGASIIGASGVISGSSLAAVKESFEIAIISYVAVMCYVMGMFGPASGLQGRIAGAVRGIAVGSSLMRLTALFMAYAI